jgi:integrase
MRKPLTDAQIRGLQPSADGRRIEIADGACFGLALRVSANGIKSWGFRFRERTTRRCDRVHIGRYPDVTLRAARLRADELRSEVAAGKNPNMTRREASERTFGALAERFLVEHSQRKKKSAHLDEGMLRNHVMPYWRNRDYTTIERADVVKLIERLVKADKKTMANRVQSLISGIFSFGMDVGLVKANPVSRMRQRGEEKRKDRVLSDHEIRLFWSRSVLPPVSPTIGLALRTVLATGCRPGEVATMAKAELEIGRDDAPTAWLIPAGKTKNGKPHLVPLSAVARDLIAEAMRLSGTSPFVFAGRYGSNRVTGHATGHALSVAMSRIVRKLPADMPGAETWRADVPTPHDLRRSCATRLSAAGVRPEDVAAVLGHVRRDVTGRHYDVYDRVAEKRAALERWGAILSGILNPQPGAAEVIPLRAAAT